ncbi:MAG: TIGR03960 family B12-binding radical SAM protein [Candidatus Aminicenantes bacterium]|nr:TIGR03960 family B12-binding radical SAM protein [Candidatus Aminicenantes bacterium]
MKNKQNIEIESLLRDIQKPGRYTGGEFNSIKKDPAKVKAKAALVFPDAYEIGMSYLGQKILYHLINSRNEYLAERVFCPWVDLENKLRTRNIPLFSLENRIPLFNFDIVGFSLLYELNYTNILTILDLGKIPFRSPDRGNAHPIIIGGGPATVNPEPIADFFDLFLIGDGEEAIFEILDTYVQLKDRARKRYEIVEELSRIKGVYVPAFYETYTPEGSSLSAVRPGNRANLPIRKRTHYPFDQAPFPDRFVVPNTKIVFDRAAVEIERGCPQKCRFCQASQIYYPPRLKDPGFVIDNVLSNLDSTGYEDVSLSALSVSDYPGLKELVGSLMEILSERKVALSLPSLRPGGLTPEIMESILKVRKTGVTLVPEAGTERLRRVINKSLNEDEIKAAVIQTFSHGWLLIKLYFMVGLPTENQDDLVGIVDMVKEISGLGRSILKRAPQINLSISSFIPKPHTPFQWVAMDSEESLKEKHIFLRNSLKNIRSIRFKQNPVQNSLLEGIFSRGDRRLSSIIVQAWKHGARFDGWSDQFDFQLWKEDFENEGLDYQKYLKKIPEDTILPWDHISTGVRKEYLLKEFNKAVKEERTDICEKTDCKVCRGCLYPLWYKKNYVSRQIPSNIHVNKHEKQSVNPRCYRVFYEKKGTARFLSQIDVNNVIQRTLRRANIKVVFSQGFHPKMIIKTLPALPLGMEGRAEVIEFLSTSLILVPDDLNRINGLLPEGFRFFRIEEKPDNELTLTNDLGSIIYSFEIKEGEIKQAVEDKIQAFQEKREGKPKISAIDLLKDFFDKKNIPFIDLTFDVEAEKIVFELPFSSKKMIRSRDIISEVFDISDPVYFMAREGVRFNK